MADPFLINGSGGAQDKLGVIAAEQVWEVDDEPTCVSFTTEHPLKIPILERNWRQQAHGLWHVTLKFEGVNDVNASDGNAVYEGDTGDSDDPVETYPGIDALLQQFPRQPDNGDGRVIWTQDMDDGNGNTVRNPMFGIDAYAVATPTWTQRKLFATLPDDLYANIDQIFNSPPGNPPLPPNSDPSDWPARNWLLRRIVVRQRGNIWEVAYTWILSGPGGWNIYLYKASGQ